MVEIENLPNIGAVLVEKLKQLGIETAEDLKKVGSIETFTRIRSIDQTACFNMLCALEGAIKGIRWHRLSQEDKDRLGNFNNK